MKLHRPKTYVRMLKRGLFGPEFVWEPMVWKKIRTIAGMLFVDVGANQGLYTLALRDRFKNILAFEPHPDTAKMLQANVEKYPQIKVYDIALSDHDGETMFYLSPDGQDPLYKTIGSLMGGSKVPASRCNGSADTILPEFHYRPASMPNIDKTTWGERIGVIVKTQRLDSLKINVRIDLLKVDVEGAEFLVLEGARNFLKAHLIRKMVIELHDRERAHELVSLLEGYDYKAYWLDPDHLYAEEK